MGANSAKSLHVMAEAMKLGYVDRYRALGDPAFVTAPIKGFVSKDYAAERVKLIDPARAKPAAEMPFGDPLRYESPRRPTSRSPTAGATSSRPPTRSAPISGRG